MCHFFSARFSYHFLALTTTPYNHVKRCSIHSKRLAELVIILLDHHSHIDLWVLYMGMYTCMTRLCAPIFQRVLPCPKILKPIQMPDVQICETIPCTVRRVGPCRWCVHVVSTCTLLHSYSVTSVTVDAVWQVFWFANILQSVFVFGRLCLWELEHGQVAKCIARARRDRVRARARVH